MLLFIKFFLITVTCVNMLQCLWGQKMVLPAFEKGVSEVGFIFFKHQLLICDISLKPSTYQI